MAAASESTLVSGMSRGVRLGMGKGGPGGHGAWSWSRWQIAAAVCVPVAVGGLGYWYYKHGHDCFRGTAKKGEGEGEPASRPVTLGKGDPPSFDSADEGAVQGDGVSKDPQIRAQTAKNKGNKYFKAGKYEQAIKCYDEAINQCPKENHYDLATYYQNRAASYEQMKKYEEVKADCERALELNPKYIKALFRKAKALEQLEELEESLEDVTAVCIIEAFSNQTSLLLADRVLKNLGRSKARDIVAKKKPVMPSKHFIRSYFSSFSTSPFIKNNSKGEEGNTVDDISQPSQGLKQAKEAVHNEKYEEVIPCCTAEIDADGDGKAEAFLLRGTFYLLRGEHTKALHDLNQIIESPDPTISTDLRVNALIKRASLYIQMEDTERCLEDFDMAAELSPDNADVYHHRGQVHLLLDHTDKAFSDLEEAVRLNPKFPLAQVQKLYTQYRQAIASRDMDRLPSILRDFDAVLEAFPKSCEAHMLYAQVLSEQQDCKKSDWCYQKAIEVEPDNAAAYVHKGMLQLQLTGGVNEAIKHIDKALEIDDKSEFAYETLGTLEVQKGNLDRAVELFDKAILLSKTEVEISHLCSLREAAKAQAKIAKKLGIQPSLPMPPI